MQPGLLLSLRVERRLIAVAVFRGSQLEHLQQRSFSHIEADAVKGATAFIAWVLDTFPVAVSAIEQEHGPETRRTTMAQAAKATLRDAGIPVWEVPRAHVLAAYGEPPCRTLQEVRRTAVAFWSFLEIDQDRPALIDAASLGAYVQIQRTLAAAREKEAAHGRTS